MRVESLEDQKKNQGFKHYPEADKENDLKNANLVGRKHRSTSKGILAKFTQAIDKFDQKMQKMKINLTEETHTRKMSHHSKNGG